MIQGGYLNTFMFSQEKKGRHDVLISEFISKLNVYMQISLCLAAKYIMYKSF